MIFFENVDFFTISDSRFFWLKIIILNFLLDWEFCVIDVICRGHWIESISEIQLFFSARWDHAISPSGLCICVCAKQLPGLQPNWTNRIQPNFTVETHMVCSFARFNLINKCATAASQRSKCLCFARAHISSWNNEAMVMKLFDRNLSVILNIRIAGLLDLSIIVFSWLNREVATVGNIRNL